MKKIVCTNPFNFPIAFSCFILWICVYLFFNFIYYFVAEEAERSRTSGAEAVYRQGMAKMFGHRPTSNKSSQPGQSSLRKNPKYNQLCEEWRFRIDKKVKEVSDGQRDLVTFPIFELVELEVDYIRSAVEDSGLSFQERGSGLDSTVCVFKKS